MTVSIEALRAVVGDDGVLQGEDVHNRSNGWGRRDPCVAFAVVRPQSVAQVSEVLRLCNDAGQPVVTQGGMTGLVSGAAPTANEVALSLERLNRIEKVDATNRTAIVQAGVPLQAVQEAADAAGLLFPLDLGARGSCTIGGNIATNAGGNRVIRYGMTRDLVLGLEAVLADGTVLSSMNRMIKNNTGYDLKHAFIGSEGTLGIVTRAVLRLYPQPRSHSIAVVACATFDHVVELLGSVEAGLGGTLSAFEVMWKEFYELTTTPPAQNRPPLPHGHDFYVLVEALGGDPESDAERFQATLGEAMEEGLIVDAVLGQSRAERDRLWALRDDVEQLDRNAPIFTYDVSLPISEMHDYVDEVKQRLAARWDSPSCVVFGHLGDGNLHVVVGVGDVKAYSDVCEVVYGALEKRSGSVSAEHGIGLLKRSYLSLSRSEAEIEAMRALKRAWDPKNLLNPGRVLPPAA